MSPTIEPGDVITQTRTFTEGDVRQFADLSGDDQERHATPDDEGRLLVHGLLTATLPTAIGSDLSILASRLDYRFENPVFAGEEITCRFRVDTLHETASGRTRIEGTATCRNEADAVVLRCTVEGFVPAG